MRNKKKKQVGLLKPRHIALIVGFFVLFLGGYVYFLFLTPNRAVAEYAAVRVEGAAADPDSEAVQAVFKAGKAVRISLEGCPNLCRVSESLYRGAQPTKEGFANLQKLGIKTVVSLRDHHSDEELLAGTGMASVAIASDTWEMTPEKVAAFLKVATDPAAAPVFVHCQHGADRTGTMVAAYRIVVQDWEKTRAIREMTHGGYGYHPVWVELPNFLRAMDVAAMKKEIGREAGGQSL